MGEGQLWPVGLQQYPLRWGETKTAGHLVHTSPNLLHIKWPELAKKAVLLFLIQVSAHRGGLHLLGKHCAYLVVCYFFCDDDASVRGRRHSDAIDEAVGQSAR